MLENESQDPSSHPSFMMLARGSLACNPTSPIQAHSPSTDPEAPSPALLPQSPPCWATQAQCDLAQAEAELRRLQERHATEADSVKRGIERAILGARREERRLLERVEQDHRDTQQHLEQVQRENMAAARVSQSLLDQRFRKLAQLQQQIKEVGQQLGLDESGPNQNLLLKEVSEFLQPWEIAVSLKKGCGPQGQMCALHSHEMQSEGENHQCAGGEKNTPGQGWTSPTGRVVRKISLSTRSDLESEEEQKCASTKIHRWLPKCEHSDWESSQDDEMESAPFHPQGEDVFLTVPTVLKNMDTEGKEQGYKMNSNGKQYSPRNQRKSLTVVSGRKPSPSPSPERRRDHAKLSHCLSLDSQNEDKRKVSQDSNSRLLKYGNSVLTSSRMTRESLTSQSCLDLTSRGRPHSCLSQSSDEHSLGTHGDSGRAPSPTDSLDSSYTFIVSPSHDYNMNRGSLNYNCRLSKSAVDLTHKTRPMISGGTNDHGVWRVKCGNFNSIPSPTSPTLNRGPRVSDMGQTLSYPTYRSHNMQQPQKKITVSGSKQPLVARSLSMSVIDGSSQEPKRGRGERGEPALLEMEEEGDPPLIPFNSRGVHLIRQFGKQGSGRADLTLPSGIHATPQGQLFIVDCGNARVQVTDPRGNVLQQVTSPTSDGSARRCRNYFDLAVSAKGLIALSCAAERALLVFNRHGRLLQTFGGSGMSSAKDELEAPRGVTVTRLDEFLVADIRKGTLIALKLEPKTGSRLERTVVTGFHRPYLVAACLSSGMIAVSERGNETGRVPCIKVLEPGWNTVRVLGVCSGMGPVLSCPWGICIDADGNVLVADWGDQHRVLLYPAQGVGWPIVSQGLSSPRGLTLLREGQLAVSDSMHHCIKIYQYKETQD
ncbi:E3 ubiquitin-protein ligase TRIM32 [Larimichthys crocea]|uniref:E3 ubiquitin-protein ligase TRIM32 n=1 Tax=Larimichthys crocea TaxID=215358 RepID=A0A6G0J823_LARCR|nr:E3 ubiquitin-protein ligase TRIM32 [Larimichthys crocea]